MKWLKKRKKALMWIHHEAEPRGQQSVKAHAVLLPDIIYTLLILPNGVFKNMSWRYVILILLS